MQTIRAMAAAAFVMAGFALGSTAGAAELFMFEEAGCVWCQRWHAEIGPGYPHSAEGRLAPLVRKDLRRDPTGGVRLARPVTATPTFVLIENGRELDRLVGYPGSEFFYPLLGRMLQRLTPQPAPPPGERQTMRWPFETGGIRTR